MEEKISLSERFGLWVSFYPFDQDEYLAIVRYWLAQYGVARCRRRADAPGGAAVGTAARLAQRARGLAVRARLGRAARHRHRAAVIAALSIMSGAPAARPVEVVAAVIQRPDGEFLLAQRPPGKVYAGYWEFPGGKVEPGEPAAAALVRELREELGIDVQQAYPWIMREYVYPHAHVRLNFFRVTRWTSEPASREAQALSWQKLPDISVAPMLPANGPMLRALALPPVLAITDAQQRGEAELLARLDDALARGLADGDGAREADAA